MSVLDGHYPEVVEAYGGPSITISEEAFPYIPTLEVCGPLIWNILRNGVASEEAAVQFPGLQAAEIPKLRISFEGLSDDVRKDLAVEGKIKGLVKGASYDSRDKHIRVYAGNISCLDRADESDSFDRRMTRVDRAFRLALGRFVHDCYHEGPENEPEDVMISQYDGDRTDADWALRRAKTPTELFLRQSLVLDLWPAFTYPPVAIGALAFLAAFSRQNRHNRIVDSLQRARCSDIAAYYYEVASRGSKLLENHNTTT